MVISHNMVVRLTNKGIVTVSDLADFDWESIKQTAEILRRSGGSIPNPNPGAAPRTKIPTPPFNNLRFVPFLACSWFSTRIFTSV